jgi:mannitol PTS system EIICBA or EIICB component
LGLLPLASLVVEPAKILFLNNAINHGVFGPLGLAQVAEAGKSIFYLIETNPGPGLGVLLACWFFGKGLAKDSAPSAVIIHFLGGIHEIYFPYVLMNPLLLASVIARRCHGRLHVRALGCGSSGSSVTGFRLRFGCDGFCGSVESPLGHCHVSRGLLLRFFRHLQIH